jgi:DNA-directed RNA polymerase subunit RPC12/RpoP
MNNPHYKWLNYNLNIACEKCGDRIIFQNIGSKVSCKSCGSDASYNWETVLDYIKIEDVKKQDSGTKHLMGEMDIRSKFEVIDHINCYHCKTELNLEPKMDLADYSCKNCNKHLEFEYINRLDDLVFYSYKNDPKQNTSPTLVAVRCVSCGAPLEADPTKPNYNCKFCSTDNLLPLSLRYKVVVNDVFIGIKRNFFPKALVSSKNPVDIIKALKQNGISSLTNEELNQILKNHLTYSAIYFEIAGNEYEVPKEIEEDIFKLTTHQQQIKIIGHRLGKSTEEIDKRLLEVNPNYQPPGKENPKDQSNKTDKNKQSPDVKKGLFKRLFG